MIAYFVERFSPTIFVPAALGIAAAARVASSGSDSSWLVDGTLALLLIAQFRLWDDLADREVDRLAHPERVLVRAERIGPYVTVCVGLAIGCASAGMQESEPIKIKLESSKPANKKAARRVAPPATYTGRLPVTVRYDRIRDDQLFVDVKPTATRMDNFHLRTSPEWTSVSRLHLA